MNHASSWRFALARKIGAAYAANPKVAAVMAAGSTGRGTADRFSDLEIDVYWHEPPTEEDRRQAVERAGGGLLLLDEDPDEWEEQMDFRGFHAATSAFLVGTMERYLREVLEEFSTSPNAQMRLYSVLHAIPLTGDDLTGGWRARASVYPLELAVAMLRENLHFEGFGYAEEMLAAREDIIVLYDIFVRVERQILGALLGLNGIYLPNPGFKSLGELIDEMAIKPAYLRGRLEDAFRERPVDGLRRVQGLVEDVFELVEAHVPEVDTAPYREEVARKRGAWDEPPPGIL